MRIICLARSSVRLALGLAMALSTATVGAQQRLAIAPGRSLTCPPHSQHCVLRLKDRLRPVILDRDETVLRRDTATLKLVASLHSGVIFTDSYSSSPGGLHECQAGTESFLRILSFGKPRPAFTYSTKLESCVQNTELSLDGVTWDASTHRLTIHWLSAPGSLKPLDTTLTLNEDGHVQ
jgi:hypothetical protein